MFFLKLLSKLFGGHDPVDPPAPEPTQTIAEIAAGNENFETLVAALSATNGLDGLLDTAFNADADITVFAPTDAAFRELATSLGIDVAVVLGKDPADVTDGDVATALAEVLGAGVVSQVLKYHVKIGGSTIAELEAAGSVTTLVDGADLATEFGVDGGELIDADPEIENPEFIAGLTDIAASNGTIQAIDRVLLPLDVEEAIAQPTIGEIASGNENFEILTAALVATNGLNGLLDASLSRDADVTVFAPTDDAFKALADSLGIDVADVLGKDPADVVDADVATALATVLGAETVSDVLKYHVLGEGRRVEDLQDDRLLDTLLKGSPLVLKGDEVIDAEPQVDNPNLIDGLTDIEAANGQIQAIDAVLLPFDLEPEDLHIVGSRKSDNLIGGGGDDDIFGLKGSDVILAGAGDDLVRAGRGNDTVVGGEGNDKLFGGFGRDVFVDGAGNDYMNGGWGADVFDFTHIEGHNKIGGFRWNDTLVFSEDQFATAEDAADAAVRKGWGTLIETDEGSVFLAGVRHVDADDFQIV